MLITKIFYIFLKLIIEYIVTIYTAWGYLGGIDSEELEVLDTRRPTQTPASVIFRFLFHELEEWN